MKSYSARRATIFRTPNAFPERSPHVPPRSISSLLEPLEQLTAASSNLMRGNIGVVESDGVSYEIPRYVFLGPKGGDEPIRLAIFAGIHGDEPEGVHAAVKFLTMVDRRPDVATGYCLFLYPICNPTGFADRTRLNRNGKDLNREFWKGSRQPEVQALEAELKECRFHGLIALHTDSDSPGFYGYAHGATFTRELVLPALAAVEPFMPINREEVIDGFRARDGIVGGKFDGILTAPPDVKPAPFETILETPSAPPAYLKEAALIAGIRSIMISYREFIAYAPNL